LPQHWQRATKDESAPVGTRGRVKPKKLNIRPASISMQ